MFHWKKKAELRHHPRWKIDRFLGVYDKDKSTFLGRVQDLSSSGMCVASTETVPIDNHIRLALEILLDDGNSETFMLRCRSLWARQYGGGLYLLGFEFSGLVPAVSARIAQILQEQAEIDGQAGAQR